MIFALLILTAFICGFIVSRIGLPPLVGYLAAGFILKAFGLEGFDELTEVADYGIMLLLFTIGLKLKIKTLIRPEIWLSGSLHMVIVTGLFGLFFLLLGRLGVDVFDGFSSLQALLIGFGLSFSSTVFAIKTFEERGDMASLHAGIAIGVLIIQDIAAVVFLTFSSGKMPSPYALLVIPGLIIIRPVLLYLMGRCGHKELLLLFGIFVPIALGGAGFEAVGLKPDLGALVLGIVLSNSAKAGELSESLLSIKDFFLVGFFLDIGLVGVPTLSTFTIALLFTALLSLKSGLFYLIFSRLRLRARSSLFSTLALSNYSEFGLLVCYTGVKMGLISSDWLIVMALALSLSFLLSAPLNSKAHRIYCRYVDGLKKFQTSERLSYDKPLDLGSARILIFGMGRIGTKAYDILQQSKGLKVVGIDYREEAVESQISAERNVLNGDATDLDLWEDICTSNVQLAMLTMASHKSNLFALEQLKAAEFTGYISAIAKHEDEREELLQAGASCAFNLYSEAGQGYADELLIKYADLERDLS